MTTTMERYFEEQVALPQEGGEGGRFTDAEAAFLTKYLGEDYQAVLTAQGLTRPAAVEAVAGAGPEPAGEAGPAPAEEDDEAALAGLPELKLVGFRVGGQELAVPIAQVQEVIRAVAPTRLPKAPACIEGIVNLRGRVMPVVDMGRLLAAGDGSGQGRFLIVCRHRGMLLALSVTAIAAMHQAKAEAIEWGVEAKVGVSAAFFSGLLKVGDRLVKILSIDSLFQKVLKS